MALFPIQHVLIDNFPCAANMLAGSALHLATAGGAESVVAANRATTTHRFFGILGDDTTNTGNTSPIIDPVAPGNYSHDSSAGADTSGYVGPDAVARPARRIGDYLDEQITNVNNWTDTGATPKRGVTVYRVGGRFRTDRYSAFLTSAVGTDSTTAAATLAVGAPMTFGAGATNLGSWVEVRSANISTDTANSGVVARITKAVTGGMIELALVNQIAI